MKTADLNLEKWLREKDTTKQELIDSASAGSASAIRKLLEEHWSRILGYALEDPACKTVLSIRLTFHLEPAVNKVDAKAKFAPPSFSAKYSCDLGDPAQMKLPT